MKKIWLGLFLLGLFSFAGASTHAANCKQVDFTNGRTCVDIIKDGTNNFRLKTTLERGYGTLRCAILFSNNTYKEVAGCNGSLYVSNPKEQVIKIYIKLGSEYPYGRSDKPNDTNQRLFPQWMYDFQDGTRSDSTNIDNTNYQSYDIDNLYITSDDYYPTVNQRVDLKIKARNYNNNVVSSYRGKVKFNVYYRTSSSSSWIKTTSSSYYELDSDYTNGYTFRSADNGNVILTDAIKFKKHYDYKVEAIDDNNDVSAYTIFDITGTEGDNTSDVNNFYITADNSTPSTNERVDITIKARDSNGYTISNYRGTIKFNIYYRSSTSASWTKTTSSTYYEVDSDYVDGYTFPYSNNGNITLYDAIRFKKDYYYKVEIVDQSNNNTLGYKTFDTYGSSSSSNSDVNDFYVTTDDASPDTNQRVDLNIKARDSSSYTITNYRGSVDFNIYYRTSTSASWTKTTSSTYYELDSDYTNGYTFGSYDNGYITLSDAIRFKKDYYYKVEVIDESNSSILGYKLFDVGGYSSDSSSVGGFSSSELDQVRNLYNSRDKLIQSYKDNYSRLRNSTTRLDLSSSLKTEMSRILTDSSLKRYTDYDEFMTAVQYRYDYTLSIK